MMGVFDFKFAAANAIPVQGADPDVPGQQTFYVLENPHIPLLPPLVIIIIYLRFFYAIQKQPYFDTSFCITLVTNIHVSIVPG